MYQSNLACCNLTSKHISCFFLLRFISFIFSKSILLFPFQPLNMSFALFLLDLHIYIHQSYLVFCILTSTRLSCTFLLPCLNISAVSVCCNSTCNYFRCTTLVTFPPVNTSIVACQLHFNLFVVF